MISPDRLSAKLSFLLDASLKDGANTSSLSNQIEVQDWDNLIQLSRWHQVTALLYHCVEAAEKITIPDHCLNKIKEHSTSQAVFNMLFFKKSVELNTDLASHQVNAFLMKGALWAWMLYENPGLREFGDIDFFLQKEQIKNGLEVMALHGFAPDKYRRYLLEKDKVAKLYFDTDYQLPLTPVDNNMLQSLEVQWNTTYPRYHYSFSWNELTENMMSFKILNGHFLVPSIENQFLMMVIHHAGVEQWDKLKFMADFVRLLRKFGGQMNWKYILEKTSEKGFKKLLLESLGLVYVFTGENYLKFCGNDLEKKYPSEKFLQQVLIHWENKRSSPVTKSWQIFYFNMIYRDRLSDKLAILFSHLAYLLEWRLIIPKLKWYKHNN